MLRLPHPMRHERFWALRAGTRRPRDGSATHRWRSGLLRRDVAAYAAVNGRAWRWLPAIAR